MSNDYSIKVFKSLRTKGYPDEFCEEIAYKYLNTEYTSSRMLGYLNGMSNPTIEEIVDEMFAIISDRDRYVEKYKSEHAQATINDIYRNGL